MKALALNVIANQPSGNGYLQVYPAALATRPVDSTLNFQQGRTTANFEVVPIQSGGRLLVYSTTATKVIVRLRGWYADAPAPSDPNWPLVGTPAVAGGRVYVNFGGLYLRALDPATGATIWSVAGSQLGPVASTAPTIANGVLYVGRNTGDLVARDPATGAVLWTDSTVAHNSSGITAVTVANGAVYASRHTGVTAHHP